MKKLTNKIVDKKILKRKIKRVDDYTGNHSKINWLCLICNHVWVAMPYSILSGNAGCPKCANQLRLTDQIIDQRLKNRKIIRLDNCINSSTKYRWQCTICSNIWSTKPNAIFNGTGCPKCAGLIRLTNEIIDEFLQKENKIIRVGNYINSRTKIQFKCLIDGCHHIWGAAPSSIIHAKTGCPKCSGLIKLTNEMVDYRLLSKNIKRVGDYINIKIKIEWQCLICNNIWTAKPSDIFGKNSGCPVCSLYKNEKLIHSILSDNKINFEHHKYLKKINDNYPNYIVDFYFSSLNLIIEYNGKQHYETTRFNGISQEIADINFVNQIKRDNELESFCKDNNIKLIFIDGRKYKDATLEKYVLEIIKNYL